MPDLPGNQKDILHILHVLKLPLIIEQPVAKAHGSQRFAGLASANLAKRCRSELQSLRAVETIGVCRKAGFSILEGQVLVCSQSLDYAQHEQEWHEQAGQ